MTTEQRIIMRLETEIGKLNRFITQFREYTEKLEREKKLAEEAVNRLLSKTSASAEE